MKGAEAMIRNCFSTVLQRDSCIVEGLFEYHLHWNTSVYTFVVVIPKGIR